MNSTYKQDQIDFMRALGKLLVWAERQDIDITGGDLMAKTGHSKKSKHYDRMAIDLNLHLDGVYQRGTEAHRKIGEKWEQLGGTWGGRFEKKDGNHYSWKEGKR